MTQVAVCSRSFSRHPVLRRELLERYPGARFNDDGLNLSGPPLIDFLDGAEKAITALERLDEALFQALPGLKVVSKYGVGVDMIDLEAMAAAGVQLGWTGGTNKRSVSELVISFAVQLLRHTRQAGAEVLDGTWRQHVGRQLSERTVGIVGCGQVGKDFRNARWRSPRLVIPTASMTTAARSGSPPRRTVPTFRSIAPKTWPGSRR